MTSNLGSTSAIAADGSETISIGVSVAQKIDRVAVNRTAGDCTSYDVQISTDPDLDGGSPDPTQELDEQTGFDPANDPAILDNSGEGYPIHNEDGNIHVQITANGGTGGNEFDVRAFYM